MPLLAQAHWAARNQVLGGTGLENGYGARQVLSWLFTGNLYDAGRWPVVTLLVGVGIAGVHLALAHERGGPRPGEHLGGDAAHDVRADDLRVAVPLVPGSSDIFIRRFEMGVQLSGILLAGIGVVFVGRLVLDAVVRLFPEDRRRWVSEPAGRGLLAGLCIVALVIALAPAWSALDSYDGHNATNIGLQADADARQGPQIDRLLAYVRAHPQGRVYAGLPTNWGQDFLVGAVPVFKYLESKNVDEVGYTLRTASLMTDPEYYFDDSNPGDYPLFGIGYLITPSTMAPPVPADRVGCSGTYCLWSLPRPGYIHVYDTTGVLTATRADVGSQSQTLLDSPLLLHERDLTVAFNGRMASAPTAPGAGTLDGSPGRVVSEHADLANGAARAVVTTKRKATVVLSASYDPGWTATVNGRPTPTVMVAPALVGVVVGPGVHAVAFSYGGYGSYGGLFVLALAVFVVLALAPVVWRRVRCARAVPRSGSERSGGDVSENYPPIGS